MLDYSSKPIQSLVESRKWQKLDEFDRIRCIYDFVRDEILFGYNVNDEIPASRALRDSYGQCNTKGTLFMVLLRAVGIPCIDKSYKRVQ